MTTGGRPSPNCRARPAVQTLMVWVQEQLVVHDGPARHRQHVPDVTVRSSRPLPADYGASRHCDSRLATRPSPARAASAVPTGRPALGTRRTLSSFSASSAFRVVPSRAPCPLVCLDGPYGRAMSVLCVCLQAGMQLAGTKRGRQDADSVGARRSAHRASTSSRARALSRQKHQDMRWVRCES